MKKPKIEINKEKVEFKEENNTKNQLKKFWNFVWNDNSWQSWVVSLLLAFIFIKFIFFPLLALILGSSMPLVVVESCSMYHGEAGFFRNLFQTQSALDAWWDEKGTWYLTNTDLTKQDTENWPIAGGFEKSDIIILTSPKNLEIGDTIVFDGQQRYPIIHRIIKISEDPSGRKIYSTKGDNNNGQNPSETQINQEQIIGKASLIIPKLGWIKLIFYEPFRQPQDRGTCNMMSS
ncbi:MAG: signal peptidase I [Nanoarchaeota archaeon]|nr:signal peptidase I [Nanoarchaeota archaeon]